MSCKSYLDQVLSYDTVAYLTSSISQIEGKQFDVNRIKCVEALPSTVQAGYLWNNSGGHKKGDIILDQSKVTSLDQVERSVKHELIHAYDDSRGYLEGQDCYHQACSEIRAARLSGDCGVGRELNNGNFGIFSSALKCVEKRAILAVDNNPICKGFSERAVERLLSKCYADYAPYTAPVAYSGNFGK